MIPNDRIFLFRPQNDQICINVIPIQRKTWRVWVVSEVFKRGSKCWWR